MIPGDAFIRPRYDEGGFADLPRRIRTSFASGDYDAVVFFLVDGLGWRFIERFQEAPFLKRLARLGKVEKLTAQFPSTTASHLTTIHTGLPVGETGVYEWFYYEPRVDSIIAPLLFSYGGDRERDTLRASGVEAARLLPSGDFYSGLSESGVRPYVFGGSEYTPSTFSSAVMKGAQMIGFRSLPEAFVNLARLLENRSAPAYVHFYFDKIDAVCHTYGPASPQIEAEIEVFLLVMEHFFDRLFDRSKRVLFLMTADHGASEVDPKTTIYLNTDARFTGLDRFFRKNARGDLLVPAGSPRDMFLYIETKHLDEAQAFLAERLQGRAEVVRVSTLIEQGYFGPEISPEFHERAGNLVILPYRHESVWWYVRNRFEQRHFGQHGGLTPEEMDIALFTCELG